ncbi:perlucin-like protein isoform X1 [Ruditapes philippinarum]|uniref:perlucin-like protein isoform X1 n=1 Tax=Ruditapes philippinarum TaxID=129788 RepID=UPI00295B8ADF|nr:perlucin-like protein isoform X1 [Ruditapes philippinarum]
MKAVFEIVLAVYFVCCVAAQECPKYHYEEQVLSKVVRLEHRLELLEKRADKEDKEGKEVQQCQDGWIKYKRSCYFISEDEMSFDRARANCQKLQADLVHIDNADENAFLTNHLNTLKGISFWIGLTDADREGDFKWVDDNSRISFSDWSPSQPDNGGNVEDCTHMYAKFDLKWNDLLCQNPAKYICEEKITY